MKIGKVVKIIDDYNLAINIGESDDVEIGQIYLVYAVGEELFDPDTKESLGKIEIVKGKGRVTHVQDKLATLESIEEKRIKRISKPIKTFSAFMGAEETYDTESIPFKSPELSDHVKRVR